MIQPDDVGAHGRGARDGAGKLLHQRSPDAAYAEALAGLPIASAGDGRVEFPPPTCSARVPRRSLVALFSRG